MRTILSALAAVFALATAASAQEPTADEIIARHVEARGGKEAIAALKTLRREGRLVIPGFAGEFKAVEVRQRPGQIRQEVTFQGLTQVQAYDGAEAWQINPFQGRKDAERLSAETSEAKSLRLASDLDTPLVDYRAKGARVDYLGLEDVDGGDAYKLRVTLKSGDQATYYIDPDSSMIIRLIEKQIVRGAESESEADFGEYEKVAGVYVPMTEEFGPKGSPSSEKVKFVFEKAEAVEQLPASHFAFPSAQ
jgi:hypothetical protein